jgi:hypothetical protein
VTSRPGPPPIGTSPDSARETASSGDPEYVDADPRARILIILIERLTGQKIKLLSLDDVRPAADNETLPTVPSETAAAPQARNGWGLEVDVFESHSEVEATTFASQGTIRTTDGKELVFTFQADMSRRFTTEQRTRLVAGDAPLKKDPLVINFGGTAAQLTDTSFRFDLDADSVGDEIAFVGPTSGFLALDTNEDGSINDGSELFGALTGDGFVELSAHDADGNRWIDEGDPVYDQLRIWSRDAQGMDTFASLRERNVGAIYLNSQSTPFELKDAQNNLRGEVRSSGVYVTEQGNAGSVQQIDLVV